MTPKKDLLYTLFGTLPEGLALHTFWDTTYKCAERRGGA